MNYDNSVSVKLSRHGLLCSILIKLKLINKNQRNYIEFCKRNNIHFANATRKLPLPDRSVDVLYSSHMIEHLDRRDASLFLDEAKRVLKGGAIIRLAVPDISIITEKYRENGDADWFVARTAMSVARPRSLREKLRMLLVGSRNHLWMYDGRSLSKLLTHHGFADPVILAAGETTIEDPGELDLRERVLWSVYVEAQRGQA